MFSGEWCERRSDNGRKTRAVLVMDSGHIILSAVQPETIASRLDKEIEVQV